MSESTRMKGLSILVTIALLLLAGQLSRWLHEKNALPAQTAEAQAKVPDPAKIAGAKHLRPALRI